MIDSRKIPTVIGGVAVLAATAIGLTAAIASAEWDLDKYDTCMSKTIRSPDLCCVESGGEISDQPGGCVAPANYEMPSQTGSLPPRINTGTLPTEATDAPTSPAPGSRAPGGVSPGGAGR